MKTRLLNLICLLVCVAAGTTLGNAQDEITVLKNRFSVPKKYQSTLNLDFDKSQYEKVYDGNGVERYVKKEMCQKKVSVNDANDKATVTVVLNMPTETVYDMPVVDVQSSSFRFYNQETSVWLYPQQMVDNTLVAEIPYGTYQFLMQFPMFACSFTNGCSQGIIIKEDLCINNDTTITINYSDAKNIIFMEKKLPNGETLCDGDFDERIGDITTMPNVQSLYGDMHLIDNNYGEVAQFSLYPSEAVYIDATGEVFDMSFKLLASDLSERYTIIQSHTAFGFDEDLNNFYTLTSEITGVSQSENIPCSGNYKTVQSSFKPSIYGENSRQNRKARACVMYVNEENDLASMKTASVSASSLIMPLNMFVCESRNIGESSNNRKYYCNVSLSETPDANIAAPLGDVSGAETKFQVISPQFNSFDYNLTPEGKGYMKPNNTFSFNASELVDMFGNSAPVNVCGYNYIEMGTKIHQPVCNYVGRMGESRQTDNLALDFSLSYNGDEVCTNYQLCVNGWMQQWINGAHEDGAYDATIINQNMMVDDMQGCNTTKVHYDTRNEDFTPPTAMMLQFRNAVDNTVTDRFEAGEEAIMYLAAKDYNLGYTSNWRMCMECLPVNVKVSYAANGTENWAEMDINEMPELFDEYSFGYIYATSLDQVMCNSANKWYDLKIELSDEAGNWQEQVISPAFRINNATPTGIEVVKANDATEVARYTVDGRAISAPQAGVNIVKMSDGTVRKVVVK